MSTVPVFQHITPAEFEAVVRPLGQPAVLKGVISDWPAVKLAQESDEALVDYLKAHENGEVVGVYVGAPEIRGHFFYGADTRSENYRHGPTPLAMALDRLLAERDKPNPTSIYVQSTLIDKHMPGFAVENHLDLLPPTVRPRIWIGNEAVTRAHYDLSFNIAAVVAGKRRFLLFPPEQLVNLYPGPFDRTIGGVPVSMVDVSNPDLERYPRFAEAQKTMLTVDLEAGDALYLPYGWWHQVHSLSRFNVLVNYWWDDAQTAAQPYDALFHAILAIRDMPKSHHPLWKTLFDYYVFGEHGDPVGHLKAQDQGSLGLLTPERIRLIKQSLIKALQA
ncbi:hypothetical protein MMA231_03816 (plasmid) [Asticcacaulis sp. MM231]|uniref:cupin-like domain-containing protein n=1 Tax=Asticcacaulis sp. MM231 TaxID=3157666 RepID=UPI0032D578AF